MLKSRGRRARDTFHGPLSCFWCIPSGRGQHTTDPHRPVGVQFPAVAWGVWLSHAELMLARCVVTLRIMLLVGRCCGAGFVETIVDLWLRWVTFSWSVHAP